MITENQFSRIAMTGMILGILIATFRIMYIMEHPPTPAPKDDSVVEVIGRYEESDVNGVVWSNLLVNDSGQLKIVSLEKKLLGTEDILPTYLIKSWKNDKAIYTPMLAKLTFPTYDAGYYETYYGSETTDPAYDKPAEVVPESKK